MKKTYLIILSYFLMLAPLNAGGSGFVITHDVFGIIGWYFSFKETTDYNWEEETENMLSDDQLLTNAKLRDLERNYPINKTLISLSGERRCSNNKGYVMIVRHNVSKNKYRFVISYRKNWAETLRSALKELNITQYDDFKIIFEEEFDAKKTQFFRNCTYAKYDTNSEKYGLRDFNL